jgi:hypothetical protein
MKGEIVNEILLFCKSEGNASANGTVINNLSDIPRLNVGMVDMVGMVI